MGIIRYIASADAEITNAHLANLRTRATGSNMGAADTMGIFSIYGQSDSGSLERARALVQFNTGSILLDRNNGTIPASGSVNFYLRMFNSAHPFTLPTNFTMKVSAVTGSSWTEGDGKDAESYTDKGAVNWTTASLGTSRASATVTVSSAGDLLAGGATTFRIVAADGTAVTATADASTTTTTDTNSPTFEVDAGSAVETAKNIVTCIGINSRFRASRTDAVVTITQEVAGTAGNTQVTLTDPGTDGLTVTDFAGGGESTRWTSPGGDYHSDASNPDTQYSQYFDSGTEDLEVDITHLVESWMSGEKSNFGVGVMLDGTYEDGSAQRSYYVKRFHARNSSYFFKRPVLEARWDSSIQDDKNDFHYSSSLATTADNTSKLAFYNVYRGRLANVAAGDGAAMYCAIYRDSGSTGGPTGLPVQSPVTASNISRGVYQASITLQSQSLNPSEYLYDVWFGLGGADSGGDGVPATAGNELGKTGVEYHTGSGFIPKDAAALSYNPAQKYVTSCTSLKSEYSRTETARLRFFTRKENWSPTIYSKASQAISGETIRDAFWKLHRVVDGLTIFSYGTGSTKETKLSYDKDGSYFDLDMSLLEGGYSYGITLLYSGSYGYTEQPEVFKFRVE